MKVGIVYDVREDYGIDASNLEFCDFTHIGEVSYIKDQLLIAGLHAELIGSPIKLYEISKQQRLDYDIIFNLAEGFGSRNREAHVSSLCELLNIPFVGTDAFGLSLTLHKHQTKLLIDDIGIHTPKGFLFSPSIYNLRDIPDLMRFHQLDFPLVLKPNREGTSMGLCLALDQVQMKIMLSNIIHKYQQDVICEEYVEGHEIAIPIIGTGVESKALGIVEYKYNSEEKYPLYTAFHKQSGNHTTQYKTFGTEIDSVIMDTSIMIHNYLECVDISRIDMKLKNGIPYFLEMTPYPGGLGPNGTFEKGALRNNMSYSQMLSEIVKKSYERQSDVLFSKHHSAEYNIF